VSTADAAAAQENEARKATRAVEAVWHIESAKVVAGLARYVGDVNLAEELAQDALVAALEQWPTAGVPRNPGAWLTTVAKRRAVDHFRRQDTLARKVTELGHQLATDDSHVPGPDSDAELARLDRTDAPIDDDVLRLVFTACHPVLSTEARVALTLRMLGGLSTPEIARAFLVSEATVAQRIVRAKRALGDAEVPFETPEGAERAERLGSVLEVIYLIFNEGYSATAGDAWLRPDLCFEALRLGRVLAGLMPAEAEVHGLVALMEIQSSRMAARTDRNGDPVLLLEQDRRRWDRLLIRRGLAALDRAEALTAAAGEAPGQYTLQAALAACHARAATAEETDWFRIARLYEELVRLTKSPVVELNRAVAVAMALGPAEGLAIADALVPLSALKNYHLLPSVRGDLLQQLGRREEARAEFERAAALTGNSRERALLLARAEACAR
jgi:RNA polymerase sigma factor (sigma-70 family)